MSEAKAWPRRASFYRHAVVWLQRDCRAASYGLITALSSPLRLSCHHFGDSLNHSEQRHLPRLLAPCYQGRQFVHWTMTIAGRQRGWLDPRFHRDFRELLHLSTLRHGIAVPVYCLMPDHMHLLVTGMADTADQLLWAKSFRRAINGRLAPFRFQKQAYDHLLRPDESKPDAFAALVHYLCENPVRAGLTIDCQAWAYTGASVIGQACFDPRQPDFFDLWWTLWNSSRL